MVPCDLTLLSDSRYPAHILSAPLPLFYHVCAPPRFTLSMLLPSISPPCHLYYDKTMTGAQPQDTKKKLEKKNPTVVLPTKRLIYLNVTSSHLRTEREQQTGGLLQRSTVAAWHTSEGDQSWKMKVDKQESERV